MFLQIAANLFDLITRLRNKCYDLGIFKSYQVSLPVWVAGNATVGGNGKTPFCIALANFLKDREFAPVILTRGYGRTSKELLLVDEHSDPDLVGDEPLLIHLETKLPVVVSTDRVAGARYIEKNNLGNIILLDDAIQHRRIKRDKNLILIDVSTPDWSKHYAASKLMPLGRFRENFQKLLSRIDTICLINRSLKSINWDEVKQQLNSVVSNPNLPILCCQLESCGVKNIHRTDVKLNNQQICLVSAIAEPSAFISSLQALNFQVRRQVIFRNHHRYTQNDVSKINKEARDMPVVCTAKDAVKLRKFINTENYYQLDVKLSAVYEKLLIF